MTGRDLVLLAAILGVIVGAVFLVAGLYDLFLHLRWKRERRRHARRSFRERG